MQNENTWNIAKWAEFPIHTFHAQSKTHISIAEFGDNNCWNNLKFIFQLMKKLILQMRTWQGQCIFCTHDGSWNIGNTFFNIYGSTAKSNNTISAKFENHNVPIKVIKVSLLSTSIASKTLAYSYNRIFFSSLIIWLKKISVPSG